MITRKDLLEWLKKIDKKLTRKIIIIAVGGTAMTLLGLKSSTVDVDFCIEGKNIETFRELIKDSKFKVDLFQDGFIFSEQLPEDHIGISNRVETGMANIDLRTLSLLDIIITKIARYNERDEEDISAVLKKRNINKKELIKRFNQIKETYAGKKEDFEYHFDLVLKRHF